MIPAALANVIAKEAEACSELARQFGRHVRIDPQNLLYRDMALQPASSWSPNRHCRLVQAADGWIAVNLARAEDRDDVAAWLECEFGCDPWPTIVGQAEKRPRSSLIERATLLGLPVAAIGEAAPSPRQKMDDFRVVPSTLTHRDVVDLSALWAGPLCGGLLAEAGMNVIKIEDPARPDPTRDATPELDRRLNGAKQRRAMSLSDPALIDMISRARILITSARPHALARLGLEPALCFEKNPGLIWIAITAHGFSGPAAMRTGFGDDCAAAGGLVGWVDGSPFFLGDALADPLTGLHAAAQALTYMASGQAGLIDVALAPTAAFYAQKAGML